MKEPQPLAYHDLEFLESTDARPLRILAEYLEPARRFRLANIQDTVVFFGSARVHSRMRATRALDRLQKRNHRRTAEYAAALKRGRKAVEWSRFYEDARRLAHELTKWSLSLESPRHRFAVCSGGGPGIMEAANRGASEAGGKSVGFNIRLPFEQGANRYITDGLHFEFHYFFMRKFWFAYLAKALVVFPGGFGTLDELSEILTLAQTQKLESKILIVLYGKEYWREILNFDALVKYGMIAQEDLDLFRYADTPTDALHILQDGLTRHYLVPEAPLSEPVKEAPAIAKSRV